MPKIFSLHSTRNLSDSDKLIELAEWNGIKDWYLNQLKMFYCRYDYQSGRFGSFKEIYERYSRIQNFTSSTEFIQSILEICEGEGGGNLNLMYPPYYSEDVIKDLNVIFEMFGFINELKEYINMIILYKNSIHQDFPLNLTSTIEELAKKHHDTIDDDTQKSLCAFFTSKKAEMWKAHNEENQRSFVESPNYIYSLIFSKTPLILRKKCKKSQGMTFNSIYDFVLAKGLLTTSKSNNPHAILADFLPFESEWKNRKLYNTFTQSKMKRFLNSFSLYHVNLNDMSSDFKLLSNYITERITNLNFINSYFEYKKNQSANMNEAYIGSEIVLGIYPLMNFRLKLLKFLFEASDEAIQAISKKPLRKIDVIQTAVYQSLFFFPILSMIIDIYYPKNGLTAFQTTNNHIDLFEPYPEIARKHQRFKLKPKTDFPTLKDIGDFVFYNSTLDICLKLYLETLSADVDFCTLKFIHPIMHPQPQPSFTNFTNVKLPEIPFLEAKVIDTLKQSAFLHDLLSTIKTPWHFSRNFY